MKFHDITIGQRFEMDGAAYVKTSPVLASPVESGAPRFMARSAQARPLDGVELSARVAEEKLLRAEDVIAAFDRFYACCTREPPESLRAAMEAGREEFLAAISRLGSKIL